MHAAPPENRRALILLYVMTVLVVVMTAIAVYFLLTRGNDEDRIIRKLQSEVDEHRSRDRVANCNSFINHAVLHQAVAKLGKEQGVQIPPPHIRVSRATLESCKESGIDPEIDMALVRVVEHGGSGTPDPAGH